MNPIRQVGANPEPNTKGCFASSGSITLIMMGGNLGYTYNITTRNFNFRTISGFSKDAKEEMFNCQNCPYDDYTKFFNYYGKHDYGDHIISSAFNGVSTQMTNGNMDFKLYNRKEGLTGMPCLFSHIICWGKWLTKRSFLHNKYQR